MYIFVRQNKRIGKYIKIYQISQHFTKFASGGVKTATFMKTLSISNLRYKFVATTVVSTKTVNSCVAKNLGFISIKEALSILSLLQTEVSQKKSKRRELKFTDSLLTAKFNRIQKIKLYHTFKHRTESLVTNNYVVCYKESTSWKKHGRMGMLKTRDSLEVVIYKRGFGECYRNDIDRKSNSALMNALADYLQIADVKVPTRLRSAQLHKKCSLMLLRKINSVEIFERNIGSELIDYVAVAGRVTYHSPILQNIATNLRVKINAQQQQQQIRNNTIINAEVGFYLGFCEQGMKQFCSDNNIDYNAEMTLANLRNIVVSNRSLNCSKYKTELRTLGITLNCK